MRTEAPIISCYHLSLRARGSSQKLLLNDVTLDVPAGSWTQVVGAPGSGKSLLFAILSLRLDADEGKLVFEGRNFDRLGARGLSDLRRTVASCGQEPLLLEDRTVLENLVLPSVVRRDGGDFVGRCEELLERAEMTALRDVRVNALSHEERLVLGVLRTLAIDVRVILLDGVLEQLTPAAHKLVTRLLGERQLAGATVVTFGREPLETARRGELVRLVDGTLTVEDAASEEAVA